MKRTLFIIGLLVMACAASAFSAKVTGVNIFRSGVSTVAQIDVEGDVRYSHQTEIAKDGKPFRIIVDILAATHEMGSTTFANLPNCRIIGIRSSQYAVDPEQIVRIVFDMKAESEYRVEVEENSVIIYVNDPDTEHFQFWSSHDFMSDIVIATSTPDQIAAPTVESTKTEAIQPDIASIIAAINESIDADRQSSLEPGTGEAPTEKTEKTGDTNKAAPGEVKISTPEMAKEDLQPVIEEHPDTQSELVGPVVPSDTKISTPDDKPVPAIAKTTDLKLTDTMSSKADSKTETPVEIQNAEPTKTSLTDKAKSVLPTPPNKTEPTKLAEVTTGDDEQSTARFRRSPVSSRKIKGTLVAEFPTRLVIKYQGKTYRDPFETLINETKVTQNPTEQHVPNVEGLRLVGILESLGSGNRALFEDKEGYGYILKAGDKVQKGYVLRVDNDKVYFQIFEYGWSRTVALDMEIF